MSLLNVMGYYVASVPQLPRCHTQARSLDEVTERIREAVELCLESNSSASSEAALQRQP
jgi:predicted RNase H-like HicB family nuclease